MTIRATINEIVGKTLPGGCILITIALIIGSLPAWITHVVTCINNEEYLLLLVGGLVWPIGVIHGYGIWFGVW